MRTLLQLAREVSARRGDLVLVSPSADGGQTSLYAGALLQYLPQDISMFFPWVYGTASGPQAVDPPNQGFEVRGAAWTASTQILTLSVPGFPGNITRGTGTYELRRSKSRDRVVEAVNSGLGQLALYCTREFKDESQKFIQQQWRYTLNSNQNWARVTEVEIQTALNYPDYPYRPARDYGLAWRPERTTAEDGTTLWQIQFNSQPPPGYQMRVWGEAYYPDLELETDMLTMPPEWERRALEWMYDWAIYRLDAEVAEAYATGDASKAMQNREAALQKSKASILEQAKPPKPGRINTPASRVSGVADDPRYLGAFTSGGISGQPYDPRP